MGGAAEHTYEARVGDVAGCGWDHDGCRDLCKLAVIEPVEAAEAMTVLMLIPGPGQHVRRWWGSSFTGFSTDWKKKSENLRAARASGMPPSRSCWNHRDRALSAQVPPARGNKTAPESALRGFRLSSVCPALPAPRHSRPKGDIGWQGLRFNCFYASSLYVRISMPPA